MDRTRLIQHVVSLIESQGHGCALVGGVAVSARARERFTKDVDFAVAVRSDAEAETMARAFQQAGYRLAHVFENTAKGLLATLRFTIPGSRLEPELDLLFASSGIEPEIVAAAERREILAGLTAPIARTGHLIATKVLAESDVREHDRQDLFALLAVADRHELALARHSVRLIEERGFGRGKNVADALEKFIKQRSGASGE